jgi:hypothetical protein
MKIRLPKLCLPALIASLLLAASALAQESLPTCTDRLITGAYGFTIRGQKLGGPGPIGPQVGVAMAHFDGEGSFTQTDTVTIDGLVVADFSHPPATGTYTVNSDCTGTFTINFTDGRPPVATAFVVVDNGNEIDVVVTSAGGNQGILATGSIGKRVSRRR